MNKYTINTSQGNLTIYDTGENGVPVVLIHGNSMEGRVFEKQFCSEITKTFRLIAPDLPGHGESDPAKEVSVYSFPGYARIIAEVIALLKLEKVIIVGWSLGGHIALELSLLFDNIQGILITGTPPIRVSLEGILKGFKPVTGLKLMNKELSFTYEEAQSFLRCIDSELMENHFFINAAMKAQGTARKYMIQSIHANKGNDEVEIVHSLQCPLAIVIGENDPLINNDYIKSLDYPTLWNRKIYTINNAGHALFWTHADAFNSILYQFLISCSSQSS